MRINYPQFPRLLLLILFLNLLMAQLLHEAGHWAVLQAFGRQPVWGFTSLVQIWDRTPTSPVEWVQTTSIDGDQGWLYLDSVPDSDLEWLLFIVAGPIIQLIAIVIGFAVARYGRSAVVRTIAFLVALINAFAGFFYQIVNWLQGIGGDEALIAHYMNVSPQIVSAVFIAAFGIALVIAFRAVKGWKMRVKWLAALLLGTLSVGPLLMLANRTVIEQVNAGNPFFGSVIGFSFPVFLTGLVCLVLVGLIAYQWEKSLTPTVPT